MPRDPNKSQDASRRKDELRRQKQAPDPLLRSGIPGGFAQTRSWPLYEIYLAQEWDKEGGLAGALVARRSPQGKFAAGSVLVDLACLGVKSAHAAIFKTRQDYEAKMRRRVLATQPMRPADPNLVAKIIMVGMAYAAQFGFSPDPSYRQVMLLLHDADPDACDVHVPTGGPEGKPFFVSGPYDNVPLIMSRLTQAVGPGGFHYLIGLPGEEGDFE